MIDNIITFNINWKNKLYSTDTDANFWIQANIPVDKINKINMVSCTAISIPKTFYNILNFYFTLYENGTPINIWLPNGWYELKQLLWALQSSLNWSTLNNIIYSVWEEIQNNLYKTGKLLIWASDNTIIKQFYFYDINDASYILGFYNDIYYNFTTQIISSDTITLNPDSTLFLNSNICKNYNNDHNIWWSNVLCSIYSSATKFYWYIVQKNEIISNMKEYLPQNIFKFWLTNERGHILNLNGVWLNFEIKIFRYTDNYIFYKKIWNVIDYLMINDSFEK